MFTRALSNVDNFKYLLGVASRLTKISEPIINLVQFLLRVTRANILYEIYVIFYSKPDNLYEK